jgi:hypothetical protein
MARLILFLFFFLVSQTTFAHNYFFAFAEVEYNELNETFEATIIAAAHDVETVFIENGVISKSLDYAKKNKKEYYAINEDLNKQFSIFISSSKSELIEDETHYAQIELILDGFEVLLNGNVQFYLSAKLKSPPTKIKIKFDLLMERFPDQQNKLTFRFRDKKLTYNYLTTVNTHDIILNE